MNMNEMSPADFAAINGNNRDGDCWGGGWMIWLIVLVLFGWGGFGNGFGGFGARNNVPPATQADVRDAVDQQTLISKLDQQTYGLADSTFALNNAITGGFASAELSRCNQQAAIMAQLNAMQAASQQHCCEMQRLMERGFADTNYNLATQSCDTRNTINNAARDIIDNANCNSRAILDALTAQRIADKDAKIAEQAQTINGLQLAASQQAQNNYLVNALRPMPVPAYVTCNPWAASYGYCCQCNG